MFRLKCTFQWKTAARQLPTKGFVGLFESSDILSSQMHKLAHTVAQLITSNDTCLVELMMYRKSASLLAGVLTIVLVLISKIQ